MRTRLHHFLAIALCFAGLIGAGAQAQDVDALRARHAALRAELASSPFGRPLYVQSSASAAEHAGEIYAVVDHSYPRVAAALVRADRWCDILMLLVNVKRCHAGARALSAFITRKPWDPVESAHQVDLRFEIAATGAAYLRVVLSAPTGPAGTQNYRLALEAAPLDGEGTFLHMSYAYGLGVLARIGLDAYLATSGRDKVGFSVLNRLPDGRPVYVDGVRGVVERNAMRYYLAIEAYLDSLDAPPAQRLEARLRDWYAGTERYATQLRESIGADEYLDMKKREASGAPAG